MPTKTMLRGPELVGGVAPGAGRRSRRSSTRPASSHWRELVVDGRDDAGQVEWLADPALRARARRRHGRQRPGVVAGRRPASSPYDRLVIATGSSPAVPPIPGLDGVDYWTNVEATETTEVPSSLVVLGGGPVGCELAQFFARMGSHVTLVEGEERLLAPHRRRGGGARRRGAPRGRRRDPGAVEGRRGRRSGGRARRRRPAAVRAAPRRHRTPAEHRRARGARAHDRPQRHRGRRAAARGRERLGDRRRHRHRALHARRQVPRPRSPRTT